MAADPPAPACQQHSRVSSKERLLHSLAILWAHPWGQRLRRQWPQHTCGAGSSGSGRSIARSNGVARLLKRLAAQPRVASMRAQRSAQRSQVLQGRQAPVGRGVMTGMLQHVRKGATPEDCEAPGGVGHKRDVAQLLDQASGGVNKGMG